MYYFTFGTIERKSAYDNKDIIKNERGKHLKKIKRVNAFPK